MIKSEDSVVKKSKAEIHCWQFGLLHILGTTRANQQSVRPYSLITISSSSYLSSPLNLLTLRLLRRHNTNNMHSSIHVFPHKGYRIPIFSAFWRDGTIEAIPTNTGGADKQSRRHAASSSSLYRRLATNTS